MRSYEEWVKKSFRLPRVSQNPWLTIDFQALGRLDIIIEEAWGKIKDREIMSDQELMLRGDVFMLSRLWVLAGYEIVRVLKESDHERFKNLDRLYKQVRIPLAKYEQANSKKHKFSIAQLGYMTDTKVIGWHTTRPDRFISREQLAGELFDSIGD